MVLTEIGWFFCKQLWGFVSGLCKCKRLQNIDHNLLRGRVCLVTGGSRGVGKGIAKGLCEAGATVYITGRSSESKDLVKESDASSSSLDHAVKEINSMGYGICKGIECDHADDDSVRDVFQRIQRESGHLDVLVNNANSGVQACFDNYQSGKVFWESPIELWDDVNHVGLRGAYAASVLAAQMMSRQAFGLIVNVSSVGGLRYMFNVPYGVGKDALDRMACDMALEFRKRKAGVCAISLWPGAVRTEYVQEELLDKHDKDSVAKAFEAGETPMFSGRVIAKLCADPALQKKNGRVLVAAELAEEYGIRDIDGRLPPSARSVRGIVSLFAPSLTDWIPECFNYRLPWWVISIANKKY